MKKIIFVVLLAMQSQLFAGNIKSVFREFKDVRNAEYVSVSPFLLMIVKMFSSGDDNDISKRIKSVKVLDLEECSSHVKEKFCKRIENLNDKDFETLMSMKDDEDNVRILVKEHKQIIKELVIVCGGQEDCALIHIKGNIRPEDIETMVKDETDKLHGSK